MSPHITFDIQTEIMKRLHVKSLLQFRSVCKAWKTLIDVSQFIACYTGQPQHLLISYEDGDDDDESEVKHVSFVDDDTFPQQKVVPTMPPLIGALNGLRVIGSSHGLLCFFGYLKQDYRTPVMGRAVIWNPSIRKSISVVVPIVYHMGFKTVFGFGVSPDTMDPMFVKITFDNSMEEMIRFKYKANPIQVEVFRLSSSKWTIPCSNLPRKSILFTWSHVVIGQFIYWLAYERTADDDGSGRHLIMSFNMGSDGFIEVDLLDSLAYRRAANISISKLSESFVVLKYYRSSTTMNQVCDVWMMDHCDLKSFTNLFTIEVPIASISCILGYIEDLGFGGRQNSTVVNSYMESLLLLNQPADYSVDDSVEI